MLSREDGRLSFAGDDIDSDAEPSIYEYLQFITQLRVDISHLGIS